MFLPVVKRVAQVAEFEAQNWLRSQPGPQTPDQPSVGGLAPLAAQRQERRLHLQVALPAVLLIAARKEAPRFLSFRQDHLHRL